MGKVGWLIPVGNRLGPISPCILHHKLSKDIREDTVVGLTPNIHFTPVLSHPFASVWLEVGMSKPVWVKEMLEKFARGF